MAKKKETTIPKSFTTGELEVKWSHLHKPDVFFGTPGDHNISVVITDELKKRDGLLDEAIRSKQNQWTNKD